MIHSIIFATTITAAPPQLLLSSSSAMTQTPQTHSPSLTLISLDYSTLLMAESDDTNTQVGTCSHIGITLLTTAQYTLIEKLIQMKGDDSLRDQQEGLQDTDSFPAC